MEEDYVSYEQAVKLKELGFIEETRHFYALGDKTLRRNCSRGKFNLMNCLNKEVFEKYGDVFSAPTLAQVDKWLRSKGLWVEMRLDPFDEKGWEFDIFNLKNHYYYSFSFSTVYDTYEEALSAGITECIKILEKECQN